MIQKDRYYLCVGTFYKKDPFEMENNEQPTQANDNSFVNIYYNGNYYTTARTAFTWSIGDGYYNSTIWRPDPVFRKGILYQCYEDGYLFDDCGQRVSIMPYNYENFLDIDFKIDDETQSRIKVLNTRNLGVGITPISQLREGVQPNESVTLDKVIITYQASMSHNLYVGYGNGNTQLEAVNNAWKSLRTKSELIRRLRNCIERGRPIYFGAYKTYSYYNTL